ncbi:MAG: hypothetical protein CYG60_22690 [Actinobacteria bacterium]|nr:MAG: hypothetical protein CYG60_22690 [Actinomycetota bacterium]
MPVEEILGRVKAAGITLTYSNETKKLIAKPTSAVTPEIVAALRECREEIIDSLRPVKSEAEVFDLARGYFGLGDRGRDGSEDGRHQ